MAFSFKLPTFGKRQGSTTQQSTILDLKQESRSARAGGSRLPLIGAMPLGQQPR